MRAHFAGDVAGGSCDKIESEPEPLESRIDDFKRDTKNMEVLTEFIDDVLQKAETEAVKKQDDAAAIIAGSNGKASQQPKEKSRQSFTIPDFKNGKVVNRARGLVVRIFDAICNCANTAAAPAQRIKLRGKRAAAAAQKEAQQLSEAKAAKQQQGQQPEEEKMLTESGTVEGGENPQKES